MKVGIYRKTAADIMSRHVASIHVRETMHDALLLMAENRLSVLPVVDGVDRCVGLLSQSDLISIVRDADAEDAEAQVVNNSADVVFAGVPLADLTNERIEDIMSESVVTVGPDELVTSVADKMLANEIHHVPVCNANGKLVGIVSTMDILGALREPLD